MKMAVCVTHPSTATASQPLSNWLNWNQLSLVETNWPQHSTAVYSMSRHGRTAPPRRPRHCHHTLVYDHPLDDSRGCKAITTPQLQYNILCTQYNETYCVLVVICALDKLTSDMPLSKTSSPLRPASVTVLLCQWFSGSTYGGSFKFSDYFTLKECPKPPLTTRF